MQRVKSNVIWIFLVAWAGVAQVYWNLAPHLAGYNTASLHTSAYLMIKGLTLVGPGFASHPAGLLLGLPQTKSGGGDQSLAKHTDFGCPAQLGNCPNRQRGH